MNKKVIGIIIAVIVVLAVAVVAAIAILNPGGKKQEVVNLEEVKIPLQIDSLERTVSATVGYPKDCKITVEDSDYENEKTFKNTEKNYSLEVTLTEDSTYKANKEYALKESDDEDEKAEEVKFGEYSGYVVKGNYDIEAYALLEDLSDQNTYVYLVFNLEAIESYVDGDWVDLEPIYNLDDIKRIINSIKKEK